MHTVYNKLKRIIGCLLWFYCLSFIFYKLNQTNKKMGLKSETSSLFYGWFGRLHASVLLTPAGSVHAEPFGCHGEAVSSNSVEPYLCVTWVKVPADLLSAHRDKHTHRQTESSNTSEDWSSLILLLFLWAQTFQTASPDRQIRFGRGGLRVTEREKRRCCFFSRPGR